MSNVIWFSLGKVDTIFFVAILVVIGICIGIYFLIPVINRKQYRQMRENLAKREASFKSNLKVDLNRISSDEEKKEK